MKKTLALVAAVLCGLAAPAARAGNGAPLTPSTDPITIAVFGDWPYSSTLLENAPLLVNSINADPKVRLVLHVGDIHSGSMPCTGAQLEPIPAGSVPGWNVGIYNIFQQLKDPVVYTPGDNEWTDCHKSKESSSGYPLYELAAVRDLFFPTPGLTVGGRKKQVESQALVFDPAHPSDAQFVENVMWEESGVVFVTLNVPGSNDDLKPWTGVFSNPTAQLQERTDRDAANLRWLNRAFDRAAADNARGVLIGLQADMWDPAALPINGGDGLTGYTTFVQALANRCAAFGRPVLLINGDSHVYGSDTPLADPTSATGVIHGTPAVPNLTRITVEGSTSSPSEWLRLSIDPADPQVFRWTNIVYLP